MKQNCLKLGLLLIFVNLIMENVSLRLMAPVKAPQIKIRQWLEVGDLDWQQPPNENNPTDLSTGLISIINDTTFVFTQDLVSAVVSCEASYPIEWTSNIGQKFSWQGAFLFRGRSSRSSGNIFDPSSFSYRTDLFFRGQVKELTANYTCKKVGDSSPVTSSSVFMFWEGAVPPPFLVLSKKAAILEISGTESRLELPCMTSVPDVEVFLYKAFVDMFFIESYERVHENSSIKFDAKIGFIFNLKELQSPLGKYRCSTNYTNDIVDILIQKNIDKGHDNEYQEVISKNTQFSFDENTGTLMCCAAGQNPPVIKVQMCLDLISCHLSEYKLDYKINQTQAQNKMAYYTQSFTQWNNGSCRYNKLYSGIMGHFQCVGQGINVIRTLYSSFPLKNGTFHIYQSWTDIKEQDLMVISVNEIDYPQMVWTKNWRRHHPKNVKLMMNKFLKPDRGELPAKVYAGESINFTCKASTNYFSSGCRFAIRYKNKTLEQLPSADEPPPPSQIPRRNSKFSKHFVVPQMYSFHKIVKVTASIQMNTLMEAIICYAPVYNTSDWSQKELLLHVNDPVAPTIMSNEDEILQWTLNDTDKIIKCQASGEPLPNISFQLNGKEITNGSMTLLTKETNSTNGTLIMKIPLISYEMHGEYRCIATNFAGIAENKITVMVQEPTHWTSIITVTVISITLVLVFLVVVWKFQLQKRFLEHLHRNPPLIQ